jgi:hypothetical protein
MASIVPKTPPAFGPIKKPTRGLGFAGLMMPDLETVSELDPVLEPSYVINFGPCAVLDRASVELSPRIMTNLKRDEYTTTPGGLRTGELISDGEATPEERELRTVVARLEREKRMLQVMVEVIKSLVQDIAKGIELLQAKIECLEDIIAQIVSSKLGLVEETSKALTAF